MSDDTTVSEEVIGVSGEEALGEESSTSNVSNEEASDGNEEATSEESATEEGDEAQHDFDKINPDELPEELKGAYKNMQAAFTKKSQSLSELEKKAQLYDQAQQEQMLRQKFPDPTKQQQAAPATTEYLTEALGVNIESMSPEDRQGVEALAKIVDAAVNKRITESVQPIQADLQYRDYQKELSDVKAKYKDFDNYMPQIRDLVAGNSQMGFEQAYKIASFEDQKKSGRTEAMKNLEVKKKLTNPKSSPTANKDDSPSGFDQIFKWAKKQVGES